MRLLDRLRPAPDGGDARQTSTERSYGLDGLYQALVSQGAPIVRQTLAGDDEERVGPGFLSYVEKAMRADPVVWACVQVRVGLVSEGRVAYRRLRQGRPGDYFSLPELDLLRRPWPGGSDGALLGRMMLDADLAGTAYVARVAEDRLAMLRPDRVTVVLGSREAPDAPGGAADAEVAGLIYEPGDGRAVVYAPGQFALWAPYPDPLARHRGMTWMTPALREIDADLSVTRHRERFFTNGATPNMVVKVDKDVSVEAFRAFREEMEANHAGVDNAYRTLYLGGGADVDVVGANAKDAGLTEVQGLGEVRICAAAQVPPVIVGVSEGIKAATYSNYGQARRRFADGTIVPLWRSAAAALSALVPVPDDAELAVDGRDVPFLAEDAKDAAEVAQTQASTIRTLIEAGFDPDAATAAVVSGDYGRLRDAHSGLVSVQLQPPGSSVDGPAPEED